MTTARASAIDDLPVLDFADPLVAADPYAAARRLALDSWIARTPNGVAILRWDECKDIARDNRFSTPPGLGLAAFGITEGYAYEWGNGVLLGLHGEDHARVRRLMTPGLNPRYLESLRPHARTLIEEIVTEVDALGRADVAQIGASFSVRMICHLLGFPEEDWPRLAAWSDAAVQLPTTAALEKLDFITQALLDLRAYTTEQLERIRARGATDNLGAMLLAAEEAGDRLTTDELLVTLEALLMAGAETTKTMVAFGLLLFARNPDQWQLLRDHPELIKPAVEELLRHRIPQLGIGRVALEDVAISGTVIPEGTFVLVAVPAANFDARAYDSPQDFDIRRFADGGRAPAQGHLSFGFGIHVCVGAHLARLELQEAFAHLSQAWPRLRLDEDDPEGVTYNSPFGVHGPSRLPIRWD